MIQLRAYDLTMSISELERTAGDPSNPYDFWINCRIDVQVPGFCGTLDWSALQAELRQLGQALDDLEGKVGTEASMSFESFEPGVSLHLSMNELGQIFGTYALRDSTHGPDSPVLKGSFAMDQSYLRPFADAVRAFIAGDSTVAAASTDDDDDKSDHVKEVYARFGLAMYFAQVLEHGIVNGLVIIDLIPSRRHLVRSPEEWAATVDEFMSRHFESTMGRLIRDLQSITTVPSDLEQLLRHALKKRNWLAHDFFRERSLEFMTTSGRDLMLHEVDECRDLFKAADERLEAIVHPLRVAAGMTDEMLAKEYERMKAEAEGAG
jgi:hypothetical protein